MKILCLKERKKEPLFQEKNDFIDIEFFRKDIKANEPVKNLLKLIESNPYITKESLSKELKLSRATITRHIKKLKEQKIIERVGSDKKGLWKLIGKQNGNEIKWD